MDRLIKEDENEADLTVVGGDVGQPSSSIVERYDRFLQGDDEDDDQDSDNDFFPANIMREEYNQIKQKSSEKAKSGRRRLSLGLPSRFKNQDLNKSLPPNVFDGLKNGTTEDQISHRLECDSKEVKEEESGVKKLKKLIEQLNGPRDCGVNGNSIFCTEEKLRDIQEYYGQILDLLEERSTTFEKNFNADVNSPQDPEHNMTCHETVSKTLEPTFDKKLLATHLESTQKARDKFFSVEQQVRELIEQLELVERYKMESL